MNKYLNYKYKCKIGRIVDGDTVDLEWIDLGFGVRLYDERVRLGGIDTPECRTSDKVEKIFGKLAKDRVEELIPVGSEQILISEDFRGKFGRVLGDIIIKETGCSLVQKLLNEKLGVMYFGQSKKEILDEHLRNRDILIKNGIVSEVEL